MTVRSDATGRTERGLVSAIIIFLDAERFLAEAIESVLAQTYTRWELLLVDDGSTDRSGEIARSYARAHPDRVRYLEHPSHANRGMSASRNLGIREAVGEYVAFLDADDVWLPRKLERQVAILAAHSAAGMVCGPTQYWHGWTGAPEDQARDRTVDLGIPADRVYQPPDLLTLLYPLGEHPAPCNCSLLVRRDVLQSVGGFEDAFTGFYEDQALLTKLYARTPVYVSSECWDRYRIHPWSCSAGVERAGNYRELRRAFLDWLEGWLGSNGVEHPAVGAAMLEARRSLDRRPHLNWLLRTAGGNIARLVHQAGPPNAVRVEISRSVSDQTYDTQVNLPGFAVTAGEEYRLTFEARANEERSIGYGFAIAHSPWSNLGLYVNAVLSREWQPFESRFVAAADESDARVHFDLGCSSVSVEIREVALTRVRGGVTVVPAAPGGRAGPRGDVPDEPRIPFGEIRFGSLRRLTPISSDFGCDRGRPVDRYYIESFLETHASDIRGRVLEIGDNTYTLRFGGERVTVSDILHVTEGDPAATIIADLSRGDDIPSGLFDCAIITQTLQLIYDVPAALRTLRRILKPGGVVLATFPGISQTYDHEWSGTWYWSFTTRSAQRLFGEVFGEENVQVSSFGNVLAATSFLHGIAAEELTLEELDYRDPGYDVTIAVRATRPPDGAGGEVEASGVASSSAIRSGGTGSGRIAPGRSAQGEARSRETQIAPGLPIASRRQDSSAGEALILMYHRVASGHPDPFALSVGPENFAEQLEVLRRHADIVPLAELTRSGSRRSGARPRVAITFDDGYADNLHSARPMLERADARATVFVATRWVGTDEPYWWDELASLLLDPGELPESIVVATGSSLRRFELGDDAVITPERAAACRGWKVIDTPPTARHAAYLEIWKILQLLPTAERDAAMAGIREACSRATPSPASGRALRPDELIRLADGGLIEVGCHTATHPILSRLPVAEQAWEIQTSTVALREILGALPTSFSYPFGSPADFTSETMSLLRAGGFTRACTTEPTPVPAPVDPFRLPRLQVNDWSGEEFEARLAGWLGVRRMRVRA